MPRRRGIGPKHARAHRQAQEATIWGLVAGVMAEAHAANAAAPHDPAGSARNFLSEAALPAVHALNATGPSTLLPAMQRVMNAVWQGLIGPEAALYGYWIEWRTSNHSGRPLSIGDTLQLTCEGSATTLHST